MYQDRIEFQLGSALELDYKIELGCRALEKLEPGERGILNLAYANDTKRAVFTAGEIGLAPAQTPEPTHDPAGDEPGSSPDSDPGGDEPDQDAPEGDTDPGQDEPEDTPDDNPGDYRTEGIPEDAFTGN